MGRSGCAERGATLKIVPITDDGEIVLDEFEALLTDRTKLVGVVRPYLDVSAVGEASVSWPLSYDSYIVASLSLMNMGVPFTVTSELINGASNDAHQVTASAALDMTALSGSLKYKLSYYSMSFLPPVFAMRPL